MSLNNSENKVTEINKIEKKWASFYKKPFFKCNSSCEENETPQNIRRQNMLFYQKKNRDELYNIGRKILEDAFISDEEVAEENMEVDKFTTKCARRNKSYANILMLSEWMLQVPEDLADNWIMVPCPVGQRTIVVACKGKTKAYTRKGVQLGTFNSALPGGNPYSCRKNCTIIDCIWMKNKKVYYALDVLTWSNQSIMNCETEFRFYWLKSQINDIIELEKSNQETNAFPILPLPNITCDNLSKFLENFKVEFPIDGLLFFHKECQYLSGFTPLVIWLKTYMVPEVFNISNPELLYEKPDDYIDFEHHVLKITTKKEEKVKFQNKMEDLPL